MQRRCVVGNKAEVRGRLLEPAKGGCCGNRQCWKTVARIAVSAGQRWWMQRGTAVADGRRASQAVKASQRTKQRKVWPCVLRFSGSSDGQYAPFDILELPSQVHLKVNGVGEARCDVTQPEES
eukprot:1158484-Pelagomonas_calceolata.AAC.8